MKSTRIDSPFALPQQVREAVNRLTAAGHVAYLVGGSVRDFLLGRSIKDFDLVTDALPDQVSALFPGANEVGKVFGVIRVPFEGEPSKAFEIATFRKDFEYRDFRRPDRVEFAGPEEDARRRDFTVNALYYDPKSHLVLDFLDGLADLHAKKLRAIGDPGKRFREDALRLLRATRFACALGFEIEPATLTALRANAVLLRKVSGERVRDELSLLWTGPDPERGLRLLSDLGFLSIVLPEVAALKGAAVYDEEERDLWGHVLRVLAVMKERHPRRSWVLGWAPLLVHAGKPIVAARGEGGHYRGHEIEAARVIEAVGRRLRFPSDVTETLVQVATDLLKCREVFQMRESTLQRWARQPWFEELVACHEAEAVAGDGNLAFHDFLRAKAEEVRKVPASVFRIVDGKDLIGLGFAPGPLFSRILRHVEELAMEGELKTKEEALNYVIQHYGTLG